MPVLTGIDVLGIQRYVFASNRLKDVLAASWMVDHVTSRQKDSLLDWRMTDERLVLAAGGNAILEFESLEDAKEWTARYSRWLQREAPGIEVAVAHKQYQPGKLAWGLGALAIELARTKLDRRPSAPQLGLSVTATCSVTGLPATSLDENGNPISQQLKTLRQDETQNRAKARWLDFLPKELAQVPGAIAEFPDEFDRMGRSPGDTSLLGIVHVDGNGVGQAIQSWLRRCNEDEKADERVRQEYREWSSKIEEVGRKVLHAVVNRVSSCILQEQTEPNEHRCFVRGTPHGLGFPLREETANGGPRTLSLPIRPILLGGDDLTFVCDGRLALDLAVAALQEFGGHRIPHLGALSACAGVALVKAHAPFHRGYALAESLCASAKRARQERKDDSGCWLDWHIGSARPGEGVRDLREREYRDGNLTMRPYPLSSLDDRKQSWGWLDTELLGPGSASQNAAQGLRGAKCWAESRSRVKRLGALVSEGQGAIEHQLAAWEAIEGDVELPAGLHKNHGFIGVATPLLDAIELLDLHVRLEHDPRAATTEGEKHHA